MNCPVCGCELRYTCPECGLWWSTTKGEAFAAPAVSAGTERVLPPPDWGWGWGWMLGVVGIGLSGVFTGLFVRHPRDIGGWICPLSMAAFSAWLVWAFGGMLVAHVLRLRRPDRLDVSDGQLRVRIWHTWSGLRESFRRTDTTIPLADLTGVEFSRSQGGLTQVFVRHRAGPVFYAGFMGPRAEAEEHAAWILGRIQTS